MLFVDTNIFLEIFLNQKHSKDAKNFLEQAYKTNTRLTISKFSIHAIESILSNHKKLNSLKKFLENIENMPYLSIYSTDLEEEKQVISFAKKTGLDFDDALQYFVAKKTGCKNIVSFDKHFDKTNLNRQTPKDFF